VEYGQSALAADVTTEAKAQLLEAPDGVPREPELGSEAALGQPKSVQVIRSRDPGRAMRSSTLKSTE
jgi:hypothetical protein